MTNRAKQVEAHKASFAKATAPDARNALRDELIADAEQCIETLCKLITAHNGHQEIDSQSFVVRITATKICTVFELRDFQIVAARGGVGVVGATKLTKVQANSVVSKVKDGAGNTAEVVHITIAAADDIDAQQKLIAQLKAIPM